MDRKKMILFLLQGLCFLSLAGCASVKSIVPVGAIGTVVSAKTNTIDSREELTRYVEERLKKGQKEISFVTETLGQEELDHLNMYLDGFYGTVDSYRIRSIELIHRSDVTLLCRISDNYYVENAILHGQEIPDDRPEAQRLCKACKKLLPKIGGEKITLYRREKRIHDLLVHNLVYDKDEEGSGSQDSSSDPSIYTSYGALVNKKAVCNGYAQAMKLLCDLTGVPCKMITGTARGENHAWNLVKLGNSWYHVDVTWDDPVPDDPDRIFYHYFNVDDEMMAQDHSWDAGSYPIADQEAYNYFVINDLRCKNFDEFRQRCQELYEKDNPRTIQIQVEDYNEDRYSGENMYFLFDLSGTYGLNMQKIGKDSRVTLILTLT